MRFKKRPQLLGAGRTRVWHHHGSDTPTSPRAILLHTDQFFYTFLHTTVQPSHKLKFGELPANFNSREPTTAPTTSTTTTTNTTTITTT